MNPFLDRIIEQKKTKEILNSFLNIRRVPHAFIFSGPDGVGKFFTAIQFAKSIYSQKTNADHENAIKKIDLLQEPYIKYIFPLPRGKGEDSDDAAFDKLSKEQLEAIQIELNKKIANPYHKLSIEDANTIKINSIRDIKRFISTSAPHEMLRFVLIENADLLNEQSQNALLKTLEEPPQGFYFILITNNTDKLLPTIKSRCWVVEFEPLSISSIESILINYFSIEQESANQLATFSEGSVQKAVLLINKKLTEKLESIISFLRNSLARRYYSAHKVLLDYLDNENQDELKEFIRFLKLWLNDTVKKKHSFNKIYFKSFEETIFKFNQKFIYADVNKVLQKLELLEDYYERNINLNLVLLNIIFEIARLTIRK
jgi:DNA polymerase-3 subunit delta'